MASLAQSALGAGMHIPRGPHIGAPRVPRAPAALSSWTHPLLGPKGPPRIKQAGRATIGPGLLQRAGLAGQHVATPAPGVAAAATAAATAPPAPAATPDPRDSTYYAAIAGLQRQHDLTDSGLNQNDANAQMDVNARIAQLAQQRVAGEKNQNQSANNAGIFYSSTNSRALNDIRTNEANQEAAAQESYRRALAASAEQRAAADNALTTDGASALQDAISRAIGADQAEPAPAPQDAPAGHATPTGGRVHSGSRAPARRPPPPARRTNRHVSH